jgi:hypothetical protein
MMTEATTPTAQYRNGRLTRDTEPDRTQQQCRALTPEGAVFLTGRSMGSDGRSLKPDELTLLDRFP